MKIVTSEDERYEYDNEIRKKYGVFCGVDEAGRGPLAGDVYAAAVILDPEKRIGGVNDSKKISEKKRKVLSEKIKSEALAYGIGIASVDEIEKINILNAAMLAMKRAIEALKIKPEFVLVDGNKCPPIENIPCKCQIGGDALSASIGAASILAKVARDEYIVKLAEKYPEYGFEKNKGYGTKQHREALIKYGPCPIHRMSFLKKILK